MEDIIVFIIMLVVGLACVWMGYLIWKKEKITLIHEYHYTKVEESDKKAYTSIMGKAVLLIGVGTILSGLLSLITYSAKCMIPFGIFFVIGMIMFGYAQMKYIHGVF